MKTHSAAVTVVLTLALSSCVFWGHTDDPSLSSAIFESWVNTPTGAFLVGHHVFVSNHDGALHVVDVSDPGHARLANSRLFEDPLAITNAEPERSLLWAYDFTGLVAIDISDPEQPTLDRTNGEFAQGKARVLFVVSTYAYTIAGSEVSILDVADPESMTSTGQFLSLPDYSGFTPQGALSADQRIAYVLYDLLGDERARLLAVEVSDPLNPVALGEASWDDADPRPAQIEVAGTIAYCVTAGSLHAIDISDPGSPRLQGNLLSDHNFVGFAVDGNTLYITDANWIHVVDASDPGDLRTIASRWVRMAFIPAGVRDGYLYCAGADRVVVYSTAALR